MSVFVDSWVFDRLDTASPGVFLLQELRDTISVQETPRLASATLELAPFPGFSYYMPTPVIDFYELLYAVGTFSSGYLQKRI